MAKSPKSEPESNANKLTRRAAIAGAAGLAGMGGMSAATAANNSPKNSLNLDDPEDNLKALLKMQADLSGADVVGGFPGEVWGWVPGEGNKMLFRSYGIGSSHIERVDNGYRFYHREIMYYLDPQTGEILNEWYNPYTTQTVDVMHIINDPVHRFYPLSGGRFAPPWPYTVVGDDLIFRINVFSFRDSPMPRADYPLHSNNDKYQAAELWTMSGRLSEVMDPEVTSASCITSWSRVGQWLPFMEMGNRPGTMVYSAEAYKLTDNLGLIPKNIRDYTEKNHPEYFSSPKKWQSLALNENQLTVSKREIDKRWNSDKKPVGGVF